MPTLQCGGTRCTSVEGLQWFFEKLTELSQSHGAESAAAVTRLQRRPSQRRRESEDAGRRLEQMGV